MNSVKVLRKIEVLLVEDDQGDIDLTLEIMDNTGLNVNINIVEDGVKAMEYLRGTGEYENATRPDLVLLDLNMPRKDGREVLQELKSDQNLKTIPVVVLTTSSADEDIVKSYITGANCYITKPVGLDQFKKVVKSLENFWFSVVKFPPKKLLL